MSELKAETIVPQGTTITLQMYPKSETDKVIAEKDEKIDELEERIDELQKATDSAWSKVNTMYDELRYHKYKRCLAMAYVEWLKQMSLCYNPESILYRRAYRRERKWKELAKKFKPNSTAQ